MRALTLAQPWATLVALGIKKVETRSWSTSYRGPLLIHAAKAWTRADMRFALELHGRGILPVHPGELPHGAIVAQGRLVDVVHTGPSGLAHLLVDHNITTAPEFELGDYCDGRFAWVLADVVALPEPIPWRGALGLWAGPDFAAVGGLQTPHRTRRPRRDPERPAAVTWRDMRLSAGLTLRQLEELCGINRGELSRFERGRSCPTPDQSRRLLAAIDDAGARPG